MVDESGERRAKTLMDGKYFELWSIIDTAVDNFQL